MKYIIALLVLTITVLGVLTLTADKSDKDTTSEEQSTAFIFDSIEYDFGVIKQSTGIQTHEFPFIYNGEMPIKITGVPTSCGCTTAKVTPETLSTGQKGILTVSFDPNLHAEPEGKFYKTINILTEPKIDSLPELKVWAEIDLDLGEEAYKQNQHQGKTVLNSENLAPQKDYKTISAETLTQALEDKHFFLVDVHTPVQEHIKGTDTVIAYDEINQYLDELPENKDEAIVLYCRSGSMSQQAAQTLTDLGYTNISHLEGGIKAYNKINN